MGFTDALKKLGLTARQFSAYALYYSGDTQEEIADKLGVKQPAVSRIIGRAVARDRERCQLLPALPDNRRVHTRNFSSLPAGSCESFLEIMGLN
jgi:DNA-binding MarR family transcriptional regulator